MNILSELFYDAFNDKAKRKAEAKSKRIAQEMQERIQAKEYNGKMYVSVDNVPMISEECLSINIIDALDKIRNTITEYRCYTNN